MVQRPLEEVYDALRFQNKQGNTENGINPAFKEEPVDFFPEPIKEQIPPDNFVSDFMGMDIEEQRKFLLDEEFGNADFRQLKNTTEQFKFLNDVKEDSLMIASLFEKGQIPEDSPDFTTAQQIYLKSKPWIQPAADIAALTVGGIVGAPVIPPFGSVAGAALSFGIERNVFKIIESLLGLRGPQGFVREAQEAGADIIEGAIFETGGQLIRPIVSGALAPIKRGINKLAKRSTLTQAGAKQRAADVIAAETKGTEITQPQIDENIRLAKEIQDKIRKEIDPSFTFTMGQLTDDASAIHLERTLARREGVDLTQSQRQHAVEKLRQYYAKKVLSTGTSEDFVAYTERMGKELKAGTKQATNAVEAEVLRLSRHIDPQSIGKNIFTELSAGRKALDDKVGELFEQIPKFKVNPEAFIEKISQIRGERLKGEPAKHFPSQAIRLINKQILAKSEKKALTIGEALGVKAPAEQTIKNIDIKTLRGINQSLNNMITMASKAGNRVLARRLKILKEGYQEILDAAALDTKQKGVEILREANSLRTSLGARFDKSTVADVLQRGARGEETRIAKANIGEAFDSLDGIDDLIRAVDSVPVAKSMMKDFYSFKLINAAVDAEGQVSRKGALTWLGKNRYKLKKLDLINEFTPLPKLQQIVDKNIAMQNVFNKSVAGRILEADIDGMIANAYRGSKNLPETTRELLEFVKGNEYATQGLKKAFAEFLTKESESNVPGFFQAIGGSSPADIKFLESMSKMNKLFKEFQPAIRIMFADEPIKLEAIKDMWSALRILERTAKSPVGGGSTTAELIFRGNTLGRAAGITVGGIAPGKFYAFKVIRDWIQAFGLKNTEQYLTKAMFDPDYAAVMTKEARHGATPAGRKTVQRLMKNISLVTTDFPQQIQGDRNLEKLKTRNKRFQISTSKIN